jgi:hypothetical protein
VSLSAALAVRSLLYWQQCWGKRSFVVMSKAAQLVQIFCPSSKQLMDATFWSCGFALKAICGSGEVSVDRLQRVTVMWWPGWTAIEGIEQTRECIHEHPNKPHRIAIALAEANEPIEWSSQLGVLLIHDWKLPQAGSGFVWWYTRLYFLLSCLLAWPKAGTEHCNLDAVVCLSWTSEEGPAVAFAKVACSRCL